MKKIISFSLWGNDPKYTIGAVKNAILTEQIYPGWTSRFYVGKSVPVNIITTLKSFENVEVIEMGEMGDWTGMFWRFYACEDADIMLSRDTDSRLSMREKLAVNEWLSSDKNFHIMRDHPLHVTEILGGMWGCRNGILKGMENMINEYTKGDFWQVDQNFLKEKIYPIVKNDLFVHDSYLTYNDKKNPFPSERINQEFIGDVFDQYDQRHPEYFKLIN